MNRILEQKRRGHGRKSESNCLPRRGHGSARIGTAGPLTARPVFILRTKAIVGRGTDRAVVVLRCQSVLTLCYALPSNPGSWRKGLSKSSACICVGPARSAPRICAHLRRSAVPLLLFRPNEDHGDLFAPRRETRNGNCELTTAVARRPTAGYGVKPAKATAYHGVGTA